MVGWEFADKRLAFNLLELIAGLSSASSIHCELSKKCFSVGSKIFWLVQFVLGNFGVDDGSEICGRYASVRAIETKSPVDDQQWLTYWVLHSLITLFELTFYKVLEW